jgi:acyl carrier protein
MKTMLTREQLVETVCRLAAEQVGADPAKVSLDTDLFNDLNFDSLDAVNFTMEIEEVFEVSIPDEEAERIRTVGQAVDRLVALMCLPPTV